MDTLYNVIPEVSAGISGQVYLQVPPQNMTVDWFPNPTSNMDLDASARYTRPAHGYTIWPWPWQTHYLDSFLPMMTDTAVHTAYAKNPFGPWLGAQKAGGSDYLQIVSGLLQTQG